MPSYVYTVYFVQKWEKETKILTFLTLYGGSCLVGSGLKAGVSTSLCLSSPFLPTPLWLDRLSGRRPLATGMRGGGALDNDFELLFAVEFCKEKTIAKYHHNLQ